MTGRTIEAGLSRRALATGVLLQLACGFSAGAGAGAGAGDPGWGILQIRDGYFWDPATGRHFIPRGPAYQTWNPPVFANQSFDQVAYDLRQFAKLRANSVRAEFVWGETEIADDVYDWTRSDFLVQTAEELGLRLFVLIGYQYPPSWFPEEHRGINDRGTRSDVLNYEAEEAQQVYREHMATVVSRYKDSPAIGGWIIGNEFAYFDLWEDFFLYPARRMLGFDPISQAAFRGWLADFYGGDIAALNANWGSAYARFEDVVMPPVYPQDRNDPGYHDLIQWRKQSIAKFLALGAVAVKENDPNHLISYSMVGGIFTGVDANNTCEDPETIVRHCAEAGAPIDFWSVNNYASAVEGSELRSLDFGIAKYQDRIGLPVMISETGHTSSETLNDESSARQAEALPSSLWESLSSGAAGLHFFHWNDRDAFTDPFVREQGFGIVHQTRRSKGPVYDNVEHFFRRVEEIGAADLLGGSRDPDPDVLFYLTPEGEIGYPRANKEQTLLSGVLRRLGYQVGLVGPEDLAAGRLGAAQVLTFPRCEQLEPDVLQRLRDEVLPAGIHVHIEADLAGRINAYRQPNPGWASIFEHLTGLEVSGAHAPWDGGVTQAFENTFARTTLSGVGGFGPLPAGFNEGILTWKIWHGVNGVAGTTVLRHDGVDGSAPGTCALQFRDHGTAKVATNTVALADTHSLVGPTRSWGLKSDIIGAIYRDYFGVAPAIQLSGPKAHLVFSDYRICRNGSLLVSLLNGHVEPHAFTLSAPGLMGGKTVENLSEGGILEASSDGSVDLTIAGDGFILLYVYSEDGGDDGSLVDPGPYRVWFEAAPQAVWPSTWTFAASLGYDTRGETLDLELRLESARPPPVTFGGAEPAAVTGLGSVAASFEVDDANLAAPLYRSTPDGGSYVLRASLGQAGRTVAETAVPVRLLWGVRPLELPEVVQAGGSYTVEVEWEELPGYLPGEEPNTIARADLFESSQALAQHYKIVLELRDAAGEPVASDHRVTREASGRHPMAIEVPAGAAGPFHWYAYTQTANGASSDVVESFEGWTTGEATPFNPRTLELGPGAPGRRSYSGTLEHPVTRGSTVVTATLNGVPRVLRDENSNGRLTGAGGDTGTVNYETGAITVTFAAAPALGGDPITVAYNVGLPNPNITSPWVHYTYTHLPLAPDEPFYLNHGVQIVGSHGSQSTFQVNHNHANVGDFSGVGMVLTLDPPLSLPTDPAAQAAYTGSFDFREVAGRPARLTFQLKDSAGAIILVEKHYDPGGGTPTWDTVAGTLDQFVPAFWQPLQGPFNYGEVTEIVCDVALPPESQGPDSIYISAIDNIRFDGPEVAVPGGTIEAFYDSRNDLPPDSDGDGIADVFETGTGVFNGGEDTGTDPAVADSDGDGRNDGAEVVAGTDPNSPHDAFRAGVTRGPEGGLEVTWFARAGRSYQVEFYDPLPGGADFSFLPHPGFDRMEFPADEPVSVLIPPPAGVPARLYRIVVGPASP